jgi:hypothetical protein
MKTKTKVLLVLIMFIMFFLGMSCYQPEDVNRDGKVDIKDLLQVQKYILEN